MANLIIDGKEIKEPRKLRIALNKLFALKTQMTAELYHEVYQLVINAWMDATNGGYKEGFKDGKKCI